MEKDKLSYLPHVENPLSFAESFPSSRIQNTSQTPVLVNQNCTSVYDGFGWLPSFSSKRTGLLEMLRVFFLAHKAINFIIINDLSDNSSNRKLVSF
jgi:hypothetical protein